MRKYAVLKIRIITGIILFVLCIFLVRLYQVQVVQGEYYREEAEKQYVHTVDDLFRRGSIFMTAKEGETVSAATVRTGFLLAINPREIDDPALTYDRLSQIISLDKDSFLGYAANKERKYIEIKPDILREEADAIGALGLSGVYLYRNQWRYYPGKELSARTIGFVGYEGDDLVGKYGLERYYDDVLRRDDERLSVNFFAEIFSNLGDLISQEESKKKGNLVTSIEPTVARTLDRILEEIQGKWESRISGGIIIDPKTGEIYALSAMPTFDLNDRSGIEIVEFRNPLVEDVYEMGSIIKSLTMASGIDAGAVTPDSTYYDEGTLELDEYTIGNYDGIGRGRVDMQEVLNQSLNTGAAHVVSEMGKDTFREYFYDLKIGTETGVDLPNEAQGLINNLESPRDIEYATASYGQGIAFTPIATVRALSTLANGGVLITPHIVRTITYEDGTQHDIGFPEGKHVFKEETSEEITRMLVNVVDDALLNGTVALPDYTIAAKTGTAQIADHVNGGYYDDRFLHSFFGYFPAYDPKFLIFLYTVEPKGVRYASETLTEPFMELTKFLINYYDIAPDR